MAAAKPTPQFVLWSDRWEFHNGRYKLSAIHQVATFKNPAGLQRATTQFSTNKVPLGCSLHVFKQGIPPVYDHPKNCSGGHFKLQAVVAQSANELWAQLTEFFVTGQFPHQNYVNGITYMKKQHARGLKVWLSKSLDNRLVSDVKKFIQSHLPPQQFINFKFCPHKYILQTLLRQSSEGPEGQDRAVSAKYRGRQQRPRVWDDAAMQPWVEGDLASEDMSNSGYDVVSLSCGSFFSELPDMSTTPYSEMMGDMVYSYEEADAYSECELSSFPSELPSLPPTPPTPAHKVLVPVPPAKPTLIAPPPQGPLSSPYLMLASEWTAQPYTVECNDEPTSGEHDPLMYDSTISPLERLRAKFNQRYADRPLPVTPVAYMSELLLLGTPLDAE
eukprot:GGOE01003314.1.p1 GENE.GGOE01003314.1~~GGOE01003314.1.p1  ORF type:complete len:401 (-),score=96.81 GGOE01003314.1:615-1775(-)